MPTFLDHRRESSMASHLSSPPFLILLILLFLSHSTAAASAGGTIGINYGRIANNLPSPSEVVTLLKREGVKHVKIYDAHHPVLEAFRGSGISLIIELKNDQIFYAANHQLFTDTWVKSNVVPYYPTTAITTIVVGNEVTRDNDKNLTYFLLPAMRNLHRSLQKLGLHTAIKVNSPFPSDVLANSDPPSKGVFQADLAESLIRPLLDFLDETSSPFMVTIYPFFAYAEQPDKIPLDYALGEPTAKGIIDPYTKLHYTNLLDAQLDAVYSAILSLQATATATTTTSNTSTLEHSSSSASTFHTALNAAPSNEPHTPMVKVIEHGWPHTHRNSGNGRRRLLADSYDFAATTTNSEISNRNLVKRVLSGRGTPLFPDQPLEVYIFSLFNENRKPGPHVDVERNFGLFYPDGRKVYEISLSSPVQPPSPPIFCVPKADAPSATMWAALNYACGNGSRGGGGVDCRDIGVGGACYAPNSLRDHATWAFNKYYYQEWSAGGDCRFGGVSTLTTQHTSICPKSWCVAKQGVTRERLQKALDYACGPQAGADCRPIQPGAFCYEPNTIEAHASWAFNSYYQKKARIGGTCDFRGAAVLTNRRPKFGNCLFPLPS